MQPLKALLVDVILAKLDRPDPELDKIWAEEATKEATKRLTNLLSLPTIKSKK
jgi:hypothetical protein